MGFALETQGLALFGRIDRVIAQRKIAKDPLAGVVDGSNRTFFTSYAPILSSGSSPYSVYVAGAAVSGTIDVDTGEVTCGSAPSTQPTATYTYTPYTVSQQLSFLIGGFQQMETVWPRGWVLVDGSGSPADESSATILVQDSAGADPLTGLWAQQGFYLACLRYYYLFAQLTGAAIVDFDWRETVRGMSVSKSRRPQNLAAALAAAAKAMEDIAEALQEDAGIGLGAFFGSPMTLGYINNLEWQTDAILGLNRDMRIMGGRSTFPLSV